MGPSTTAHEPAARSPGVALPMAAEAFGTFLLVFLGCGAVHTAVLLGSQSGLWQVAIVWGLAIMLAVFAVGAISGAHINPAITIALAAWGLHPWRRVLPYVVAQMLGAFAAAAVLFTLFSGFIAAKEQDKGVARGEPGSIVTAMCYGEYYPNPGPIAAMAGPYDAQAHAMLRISLEPHGGVDRRVPGNHGAGLPGFRIDRPAQSRRAFGESCARCLLVLPYRR